MARPYPNPTETARHNLVHRIGRFLATHAGEAALSPAQLANLAAAIEALREGNYPAGEDAAMLAENNWKPRHGAIGKPTLAALRDDFEKVQAA